MDQFNEGVLGLRKYRFAKALHQTIYKHDNDREYSIPPKPPQKLNDFPNACCHIFMCLPKVMFSVAVLHIIVI
jgi:hypothetical protein